jgi:2,3-bisphosphoglycerate-dependent phosphoglycerate mutase
VTAGTATNLVLVRHAEPVRLEGTDGPADPTLSERGWRQAELLGEWLGHESVDHLASSPKRRAQDTAVPLARRLGISPVVIDDLIEIDRTATSYIPIEELRAEGGPLWEALRKGDWAAVGYDEPAVFRARVVAAFQRLLVDWAGTTVVVFCHGGVINAWASHVLGIDRSFFFEPAYCSIHRFRIGGEHLGPANPHGTVVSLNETGHYDGARHGVVGPHGV